MTTGLAANIDFDTLALLSLSNDLTEECDKIVEGLVPLRREIALAETTAELEFALAQYRMNFVDLVYRQNELQQINSLALEAVRGHENYRSEKQSVESGSNVIAPKQPNQGSENNAL